MTRKNIDEVGALFRFITPILIVVVGFFLSRELNQINRSIESLKAHETSHSVWAQKVLRMIEIRFTRIENKIGIENNIELDPGEDNGSKNFLTIKEAYLCNFLYPDFGSSSAL